MSVVNFVLFCFPGCYCYKFLAKRWGYYKR